MLGDLRSLTFTLDELSTSDNLRNGVGCHDLYTWHADGDIYFGKMVGVEPVNILYKRLRAGNLSSLTIGLIDGGGNPVDLQYPMEVVLHMKKCG